MTKAGEGDLGRDRVDDRSDRVAITHEVCALHRVVARPILRKAESATLPLAGPASPGPWRVARGMVEAISPVHLDAVARGAHLDAGGTESRAGDGVTFYAVEDADGLVVCWCLLEEDAERIARAFG